MASRQPKPTPKLQQLLFDVQQAKRVLGEAYRVDKLEPQPLDFDALLKQIK